MMRKMIYGSAGAAAALVLAGLFFFGGDFGSYMQTSVDHVRSSARDNVPISFEIERARQMIKELTPDIKNNMHVIAEEEVELTRLNERIAAQETKLATQRQNIMTLKTDLSSPQTVYVYNNKSYSPQQVKLELAHRFDRYKTEDATLKSLEQIRTAREQSLSAGRQKLDGMIAAKRQLEVDVENLEAQLKLVEAAQTTSSYNFDDSRLSKAKELVQSLRTRLEVTSKMVNAESQIISSEGIELGNEAPADVVEQVTDYFSQEKPTVADAPAKSTNQLIDLR